MEVPVTEERHHIGQTEENSINEVNDGGIRESSQPDVLKKADVGSMESQASTYNMSHMERGHCLIFNHGAFDTKTSLGPRKGTDRDCDKAEALFISLGFQVTVHSNLRVDKIKEKIQDLASKVDHTDCDSLAVVFMSHGEQDVLFGYDGTFKADFIFESFQADLCPSLAGKPKLFFIQACRGTRLDAGTNLEQEKSEDEVDCGYQHYRIPSTRDTLIGWSTIPGYFSWRNTTHGSWFMQSLVHVLSRDSGQDDLLSMMTSVNRHLSVNYESNCPTQEHMHGMKQAACIISTLMRKVYFTPKN